MAPRRFVLAFLAIVASGWVLFQASLLWLNPFGLFPWPIHARNAKPMHTHGEVFKARMLEQLHPEFVVFGNSRAEAGFRVDADVTGYGNGANAGISGGTFPEIALLIDHALMVTPAKAFLWVVDPNSFAQGQVRPPFKQLAIGHPTAAAESLWHKLAFQSDWSFLRDEAKARLQPAATDAIPYLDGNRGLRGDASMHRQTRGYGGARKASEAWEAIFADQKKAYAENTADNLARYQGLLARSCARGIRVVTLVPPIHARMVAVWERTYGAAFLARWLERLDAANREAAAACPGNPPELWTALVDSPIRSEPLPPADAPEAEMTHYWESSHFRHHLGDDVVRQIFLGQKARWIVAERSNTEAGESQR